MQPLVLLPFLVASAFAGNLFGVAPIAHAVEPLPQYTQEQNTATGEYGYSYHGGPSAKTEFRAIDGTTTGTYSYVDAHGILQTVNYIADEFGFRAAGSNIPSEGSVPLDAPDVAAAKAAHLAEHSRATLEALNSQHRRKRGAILPAIPVAHAAIPVAHAAIPVAHALPIATSSQHRVQIHNSAHLLTPSLIYRKKRGIAAYAAPLPPSSAKILGELSQQSLFRAAPAAIAAPLAAHAAIATPLAAPAAIATHSVVESVPLATSSQSRFQVHNGAKIVQEISTPVLQAAPVLEARAALPVASHAVVETRAALPVATHSVVESLPLATSNQRRFQVHNGAKIIQEFHQPLYAAAAPALPAFAPVHAPALPAAPVYPGSLNHEFGGAPAALPAEAASFGDDAITVESA